MVPTLVTLTSLSVTTGSANACLPSVDQPAATMPAMVAVASTTIFFIGLAPLWLMAKSHRSDLRSRAVEDRPTTPAAWRSPFRRQKGPARRTSTRAVDREDTPAGCMPPARHARTDTPTHTPVPSSGQWAHCGYGEE